MTGSQQIRSHCLFRREECKIQTSNLTCRLPSFPLTHSVKGCSSDNSGDRLTSVQLIAIDGGELVMLEWREVPLAWSCVTLPLGPSQHSFWPCYLHSRRYIIILTFFHDIALLTALLISVSHHTSSSFISYLRATGLTSSFSLSLSFILPRQSHHIISTSFNTTNRRRYRRWIYLRWKIRRREFHCEAHHGGSVVNGQCGTR